MPRTKACRRVSGIVRTLPGVYLVCSITPLLHSVNPWYSIAGVTSCHNGPDPFEHLFVIACSWQGTKVSRVLQWDLWVTTVGKMSLCEEVELESHPAFMLVGLYRKLHRRSEPAIPIWLPRRHSNSLCPTSTELHPSNQFLVQNETLISTLLGITSEVEKDMVRRSFVGMYRKSNERRKIPISIPPSHPKSGSSSSFEKKSHKTKTRDLDPSLKSTLLTYF